MYKASVPRFTDFTCGLALFVLVMPGLDLVTSLTLQVRVSSTKPRFSLVFYHSVSQSIKLHSQILRRGRRRLHAWRSGENSLQSGWQSVGMLSLPRRPEISGEGSGSRPPQPINKGGLGLVSFALLGSLTALSSPAKAWRRRSPARQYPAVSLKIGVPFILRAASSAWRHHSCFPYNML